jgi:hypothetical protein
MKNQRDENLSNGERAKGWAAVLLLLLLAALTIYRLNPPDAVPANAPPDQFSSARALEQLKVIAARPHPIGSTEHDAVRDYLLGELGRLGLETQVQKATGINTQRADSLVAATVQNVLGRIKGTGGNGKALMLAAHYDAVPHSFGASDDGAGVAALLETARALKAGAPLKNDVIFLFTDGEEVGLLGAEAFVHEHPWAKDVGVVCNFEARGNRGPVYMFETSRGNGRLIEEFGEAAPRPSSNSLMSDLYHVLPNDTDFTIFKAAKLEGLNFAYIDGLTHYHTSLDNIRELDERSLGHHGQYALALAKRFGNGDLRSGGQTDAVYFDVLGLKLVRYSNAWTLPLMVLVYVLLCAVILLGLKRKRLRISGIVFGFLAFLLSIICAVGVVSLVWRLVGGFDREHARMLGSGPYNGNFYFICFVVLAIAVVSALYMLFARKLGWHHLLVGALICWVVIMTLSGLFLQGGSYLFIWPLLFMLAALVAVFYSRREEARAVETNDLLLLSLCAVPGIVLLIPAIHAINLGLGMGLVGAAVFPLILLLGLLFPALDFLTRKLGWWLPAALCVLSLALLIGGSLSNRFDNRHPEPDSLFYVLNSDAGKAIWMSFDREPDAFTSQFFPAGTGRSKVSDYLPNMFGSFLNAQAPAAALAAPMLEVSADEVSGGMRRVRLRLSSPR